MEGGWKGVIPLVLPKKKSLQEFLAGIPRSEPIPVLSETQLSDFKCVVEYSQHSSNDSMTA